MLRIAAERGWREASLAEIAAAAGVSLAELQIECTKLREQSP
ncbi:MAG: TetR family transcriptional regulator [Alphaproteobacteria bacterium]|nr:TetR family transcriptional regulator [Alphaproteobacteria bacterium]